MGPLENSGGFLEDFLSMSGRSSVSSFSLLGGTVDFNLLEDLEVRFLGFCRGFASGNLGLCGYRICLFRRSISTGLGSFSPFVWVHLSMDFVSDWFCWAGGFRFPLFDDVGDGKGFRLDRANELDYKFGVLLFRTCFWVAWYWYIAMNFLDWNYQYSGIALISRHRKKMVTQSATGILFLNETKKKKDMVDRTRGFTQREVVESMGLGGRSVVFWKDRFEVEVLQSTRKINDMKLSCAPLCLYLTFVYEPGLQRRDFEQVGYARGSPLGKRPGMSVKSEMDLGNVKQPKVEGSKVAPLKPPDRNK